MPGFSVPHHLQEFVQTPVHGIGDAIQPSHPLLSPSPPAFDLSQHHGLFQWIGSLQKVAKVSELQHQSFQWMLRVDFLKDWLAWSSFSTVTVYLVGLEVSTFSVFSSRGPGMPSLPPSLQPPLWTSACWFVEEAPTCPPSLSLKITFHGPPQQSSGPFLCLSRILAAIRYECFSSCVIVAPPLELSPLTQEFLDCESLELQGKSPKLWDVSNSWHWTHRG